MTVGLGVPKRMDNFQQVVIHVQCGMTGLCATDKV